MGVTKISQGVTKISQGVIHGCEIQKSFRAGFKPWNLMQRWINFLKSERRYDRYENSGSMSAQF